MRSGAWSVALALLAAAAATAIDARRELPIQPIAFDHAKHAEQELACVDCHARVESTPYAGLPSVKQCMLCHSEPQGEHPDEARVREYAEKGEEIPWRQFNRVAGHVYFSHAVHVKLGAMQCSECHGDMSKSSEPVLASQVEHLTMRRCMECHDQRGASNDCLACHK